MIYIIYLYIVTSDLLAVGIFIHWGGGGLGGWQMWGQTSDFGECIW